MATLAAIAALLTLAPGFAIAETLTNAEIVELTKAGLGPDAILAKIQTSANAFDTSTQQLLVLKRQGVPDVVIAAMLRASSGAIVSSNAVGNSTSADPRSPHASGIYMIDDDVSPPQMQHIDPTVGSGSKTSGVLAYAFTYGIAPVKIKTVIPNASARVRSRSGHPTFYFYFNQTDTQLSGNGIAGVWLPGAVTSPSEFSLVRFEVAHGSRETELGQFNLTGLKSGVMDKARVAFSYDDVAPGVFKVTPSVELRPGQYGFVYSTTGAGAGFGGMPGARIF
ncbi:MAG TPA: hypothetical protein VGM09_17660, partial [Bradyrhizobium sp.]